jgi:hypothetical protein
MILDAFSCLLGVVPADVNNECLQYWDHIVLLLKKVNPVILKELLSESQDQSIKDFIVVIDLKPEKKPLKELIKNAYKENEFIRDILAVLYKQEGYKVYY